MYNTVPSYLSTMCSMLFVRRRFKNSNYKKKNSRVISAFGTQIFGGFWKPIVLRTGFEKLGIPLEIKNDSLIRLNNRNSNTRLTNLCNLLSDFEVQQQRDFDANTRLWQCPDFDRRNLKITYRDARYISAGFWSKNKTLPTTIQT